MLPRNLKLSYFLKNLRFYSNYSCIYSTSFETPIRYEKFSSLYGHNNKYYKNGEKEGHWKENKYGFENKLPKILGFLPIYIILSLYEIQDVSCEDLMQEKEIQLSEKNTFDAINSSQKLEKKAQPETDQNKKQITHETKLKESKEKIGSNSEISEEEKFNSRNPDIDLSDSENKKSNESRPLPNFRSFSNEEFLSMKKAIDLSRNVVLINKTETGSPGISVAVSVNGKMVWSEGVGYSDLENATRMTPFTVMRIASISKSLTMVAVGKLVEEGKLDLDAPVQKYVPSFPKKIVNGEEVTITTRHLLNHTSGIRHYKLKEEENKEVKKLKENIPINKEITSLKKLNDEDGNEGMESTLELSVEKKRENIRKLVADKIMRRKPKETNDEFDLEEYYIKEEFETIEEALKLFENDDLLFKPGEKYYYSTHGYTLVSAVVEAVAKRSFNKVITELFEDLALKNTHLDKNDSIIYRRGRYYVRNKNGLLENAPYVNNSCKWAGGGFISNVIDITKFGNMMLYSYQNSSDESPEGFLKSSTVRQMWTASSRKNSNSKSGSYGLGWGVVEGDTSPKAYSYYRKFYASHTGGAVGASSVLLIMPTYDPFDERNVQSNEVKPALPQGIIVSVVTNMQGVGLHKLALKIANIFDRVHQDPKIVSSAYSPGSIKVYSLEKS